MRALGFKGQNMSGPKKKIIDMIQLDRYSIDFSIFQDLFESKVFTITWGKNDIYFFGSDLLMFLAAGAVQ